MLYRTVMAWRSRGRQSGERLSHRPLEPSPLDNFYPPSEDVVASSHFSVQSNCPPLKMAVKGVEQVIHRDPALL